MEAEGQTSHSGHTLPHAAVPPPPLPVSINTDTDSRETEVTGAQRDKSARMTTDMEDRGATAVAAEEEAVATEQEAVAAEEAEEAATRATGYRAIPFSWVNRGGQDDEVETETETTATQTTGATAATARSRRSTRSTNTIRSTLWESGHHNWQGTHDRIPCTIHGT